MISVKLGLEMNACYRIGLTAIGLCKGKEAEFYLVLPACNISKATGPESLLKFPGATVLGLHRGGAAHGDPKLSQQHAEKYTQI